MEGAEDRGLYGSFLQQVQHDLALELRSAENRIKHLSQQLALSRLAKSPPTLALFLA